MNQAERTVMKRTVYRVQDKEGRGPFRPGFSQYWLDDDLGERVHLPCWSQEFGDDLIQKNYRKRHHYGSAVTNVDLITIWFSPSELLRLYHWGYSVVSMEADRILAESTLQVVIERKRPFHKGVSSIPLANIIFRVSV